MHRTAHHDRIAAYERKLAALTVEHSEISLRLEDNPDDAEANTLLDQIEQEQKDTDKTIARARGAAAAEAKRNTAAGKAAELALLKTKRAEMEKLAKKRRSDALDFLKALSALALPIAKWQRNDEEMYAAARFIVAKATAKDRDTHRDVAFSGIYDTSKLRDGGVIEALVRALTATGLGQTGPDFGPYLTVSEVSSMSIKRPLEEAVDKSNERLLVAIDRHLERAEAMLKAEK